MMILPHTHKQKEEEGKCKSGDWTTLKPYINILKSKNWNEQENWYEWWYVFKKKKNHIKKKRPAPMKRWVYDHQRPKIL